MRPFLKMLGLSLLMAILLALQLLVEGAPVDTRTYLLGANETALLYLHKFGYLSKGSHGSRRSNDPKIAIARFQKKAGLPPTGSLDQATLTRMAMPRCGVPDVQGTESRFNLGVGKWTKKQLTYKITKYPAPGRFNKDVDREIGKAFQMWSEVTDFTFRVADPRVDDRADIDISFQVYDHGDKPVFDGQDGILAHAFYPTNGVVHFDDSEEWTTGSGTDLLQVATHEFGHTLGLDHSDNPHAIMAPIYFFRPDFQLQDDDIQGVQALYGPKTPPYSRNLHKTFQHQPKLLGQRQPQTYGRQPLQTLAKRPQQTYNQRLPQPYRQHLHQTFVQPQTLLQGRQESYDRRWPLGSGVSGRFAPNESEGEEKESEGAREAKKTELSTTKTTSTAATSKIVDCSGDVCVPKA